MARSQFFLLTWLLANVCAALRRAAQYFETETRALFRKKIQQASTRRAARVTGRLWPGIPPVRVVSRSAGPERNMARESKAGANKCLEDERALPRRTACIEMCLGIIAFSRPRRRRRCGFTCYRRTWRFLSLSLLSLFFSRGRFYERAAARVRCPFSARSDAAAATATHRRVDAGSR